MSDLLKVVDRLIADMEMIDEAGTPLAKEIFTLRKIREGLDFYIDACTAAWEVWGDAAYSTLGTEDLAPRVPDDDAEAALKLCAAHKHAKTMRKEVEEYDETDYS